MKVWYVAEGFDDEGMDRAPWEYDLEWSDVNLFVSLKDKKPTPSDKLLMIGQSFDDVVSLPSEAIEPLKEWPKSELDKRFFKALIRSIFDVPKIGALKWN